MLKAPEATGATGIGAAGPTVPTTLTCTSPGWAEDVTAAAFYRSPTSVSYSWTRDGGQVPGASSTTIPASVPGTYRCTATATNFAGSVSQQSGPLAVAATPAAAPTGAAAPVSKATLKVKAIKYDKRRGTATLVVSVSGPGTVTLAGKGLVKQIRASSGAEALKVPVKSKGALKRRLRKVGRAKVKANLAFAPHVGGTISLTIGVKLVESAPKR